MYVDDNDGYRYLLTVIDHFSNFGFGFPLHTKTAEEVAIHLHLLFCVFGPPTILHSDNGGEFVNRTMDVLRDKYGIQAAHGKAYNPREQGKVEKFNGTIATLLAKKMHEQQTQ